MFDDCDRNCTAILDMVAGKLDRPLFLFDRRTVSAFSNSFAFDIISIDDVLGSIL